VGGRNSGRGGVFTPEIAAQIIKHLRAGAFKTHAAAAAGVSISALGDWLEKGAAGDPRYAAFARDAEIAIAEDAVRNQAIISAAAAGPIKGDWKAAAWNLERKYPKLYGRMAAVEQLADRERPYSPWKQPVEDNGAQRRYDA